MSESGIRYIEPPTPDERVIAYEIVGHVTVEDMREITERVERVMGSGKKALLYQDMESRDGFEPGVVAEKLKHMKTLWKGIEKIAVLGDSRWLEIYIGAADVITPQQMKHFNTSEQKEAFAWLMG